MPTGERAKVQDVIPVDYTGPKDFDKMPFMENGGESANAPIRKGNLIRGRRNAK